MFTHLKLCLATATHNFEWVKIKIKELKNKIINIYVIFAVSAVL